MRSGLKLATILAGAILLFGLLGLALPNGGEAGGDRMEKNDEAVDFNRDVRPILSNTCFQCHGPDAAAREAGLRLDRYDGATAALESGGAAIVPGDPEASKLIARITSGDPDFRMPPPSVEKSLSEAEIEVLTRWVEQGATYQRHWSFMPPTRPPTPDVARPNWQRNPIDTFILARLEAESLAPSPEASKAKLLRRASFDLTGLPPTLEELDAFLADQSPGAYERAVDRLLDSPRYGEHMARYWLDAARYGDTHGLHLDNYREMWRWRDWVIEGFNDNMPFDRFTVEQLAGDLLPDPSLDQLIATGFNRNNVTTAEGGAIEAEFLVKYAVDRVETTSTVWLGLTAGCAVCHDHKFDPLTQKQFYELYAFFNNVAEKGLDENRKDPPPAIKAPTPAQQRELEALTAHVREVRAQLDAPMPEVDAAQQAWEAQWRPLAADRWRALDPESFTSSGGATLRELEDHSILAGGANPAKDDYTIVVRTDATDMRLLRLEALTHESLPFTGPGRADNANFVLSEIDVEAVSLADPSKSRDVELSTAYADFSQESGGFLVEKAIDGVIDDATNGWAVAGYERRENRTAVFLAAEPFGYEGGTELRVRLHHQSQYPQHAIGRVRLSVSDEPTLARALQPVEFGGWIVAGPFAPAGGADPFRVAFAPEQATIDEPIVWRSAPALADGEVLALSGENVATYLRRSITARTAREIELSIGSDDAVRLWLNGKVILDRPVRRAAAPDQDRVTLKLAPGRNDLMMKVVNYGGEYAFYFDPRRQTGGWDLIEVTELVSAEERSPKQAARIRRFFRQNHSPRMKSLYAELAARDTAVTDFEQKLPTTLIMRERDERRPAHVLMRGQYDQPGEEVQPDVPDFLPPLPADQPRNRLALAQWLVDPSHPLTARVTVNRLWQQVFGTGLVRTAEDFGSQGERPSHPALLDWLAVEFIESGWDVKHMMRLMVTSSTYRQSSRVSADLLGRDPENRLLARGPRFRLDAEMIRDQALAASGLLVERTGGPSVKPYQPPGLWEAVGYPTSDTSKFQRDQGEALYRRSLYSFWKRTSPPPNMAAFDAPNRETCTVDRPRTNTPLQALVLMNDTQFVEASRKLAERMMLEGGSGVEEQIGYGFRIATSRRASTDEIRILRDLYHARLSAYRSDQEAAAALLGVGESPVAGSLEPAELAAMTAVANTLLSLDEVLTKG